MINPGLLQRMQLPDSELRPSMVVTCLPSTSETGVTQDLIATPSIWTVQAPHCAMPQPNFVPVRASCSRKTQSRGLAGSTSTVWRSPYPKSCTH